MPFYLSGVVVTLCLTRCGGKIGLLYFADLVGAACGALLIQPLLEHSNAASTAIACGAIAALAAACFRLDRGRAPIAPIVTAGILAVLAYANLGSPPPVGVWYSKGKFVDPGDVEREEWNIHAQVIVRKPKPGAPIYWGPGSVNTPFPNVDRMRMLIDGDAGTYMTEWDGEPSSLDWIRRDVTSLPHHLRTGGTAGVIGVGGGRDLLTALWAEHASVTGIEINDNFIELLEGPFREYANLATQPQVKLVHDEAPVLPDARRHALRRAADVADRHLGRDRRRRVHLVGERPLHRRGLARVHGRARGRRPVQRVALVRPEARLGDQPTARAGHARLDRARRDDASRPHGARRRGQGRHS